MRFLAVGAFVLGGAASVGFAAMMAFGDGRMTPLNGFVLSALLLGFFSALGSVVMAEDTSAETATALLLSGAAMFDRLPDAAKRDVRRHFPPAVPVASPAADPARHLDILTQPSIDASLAPVRVQ